ncbi:MAG: DUF2628 domain-containing protein [Halioglobus sp.]
MEVQEYYRAATGEKNAEFYLSRFEHFDSHGVAVSWHWPAFFFSFYWLLHRKMPLFALLYILFPLAFAAIDMVIFPADDVVMAMTSLLYLAATFIALPLYANALYYHQVKKRIHKALSASRDNEEAMSAIIAGGGIMSTSRTIVTSFAFVAVLMVAAAVLEQLLNPGY